MEKSWRFAALGLSVICACGDGSGREVSTTMAPTSMGATETDTGDTGDTGSGTGDSGDATTGPSCADECPDGVCVGDVCCEIDLACGDVCCGSGEVCSFQECVVPGDDCIDASECPDGFYCEYSLGEPGGDDGGGMCQGGVSLDTGKCLPKPPECEEGVEPDLEELDCLPKCEYFPETSFAPELKYSWELSDIMMPPIVIQLDDDNCDNVVDERDIPEIVFMSFEAGQYNDSGTMHAVSIVDGQMVEKWSASPALSRLWPGRALAGGNIDGLPGNEIVACTSDGRVRSFAADGAELWVSDVVAVCDMPSIADLDQDGQPEILLAANVLDGQTGAIELSLPLQNSSWWSGHVTAADADGDGMLELVTPQIVYEADGTAVADSGLLGTFPAVADLDLDGDPEIIAIDNRHGLGPHHLNVWRLDPNMPGGFEIIRQGIDINGALSPALCPANSAGNIGGGGPPTVADFNGDGTPDVGVAGGIGYAVFDGAKLMDTQLANTETMMWIKQSQDCSSAFTGSSVFDFDGDGSAEVVYADEQYMRIYRGVDGEILLEECNTSGTLHEYPLVADVDNDGHADIVVVSNSYSTLVCPDGNIKTRGLRIFGDEMGLWVRTRRIWNQHAYHVTNVNEDGSIPMVEASNWSQQGLNNFRQNVQPEGEFSAPDLVAKVLAHCTPDEYGLIARVRNIGQAAVPQGVAVGFYAGDPNAGGLHLGTEVTTKVLYPAESEDVLLLLPDPPQGVMTGDTPVHVVVDDGMPDHPWHECLTDNNEAVGDGTCAGPG